MPADDLPTAADLTIDEVRRLLDPEAKEVPELRPNARLDSERTRLQSIIDTGDDRERGLALADLSMRIVNPDVVEAEKLAASALEIGERLHDDRIIAAGHCTLGWAMYNRDWAQWRKAADHAIESEFRFRDLGMPEWEAQALILQLAVTQLSGSESLVTRLEPTISSLLRGCTREQDAYVWLFALSRLSLSTSYFAHNDYELADRYLALTVLFARQIPEPFHVADVHAVAGGHDLSAGRYMQARAHEARVGLIGKVQRSKKYQLISLWYTAEALIAEGDVLAARAILDDSRDLLADGTPDDVLAHSWNLDVMEVDALKAEGRWNEAEKALLELAPTLEKTSRNLLKWVNRTLIDIYKRAGTIGDHTEVYDRLIKELERTMNERSALQLQAVDLMQSAEIRRKLRRSDEMLRGILPSPVYSEIVESGESEPRYYPNALLFLSDFSGFTRIASALTPRQLIEELSDLFGHFDAIMAENGCEHIETIGDAYLAVASLISERSDSDLVFDAGRIAAAALEVQDYLTERNTAAAEMGGSVFFARIGLHTGPIIGGVVGRGRRRFGVFGDPVNTVQRFEAACDPGGVLVSKGMHALLTKGTNALLFQLEPRDPIEAKGKGALPAWRLIRQR